MRGVSALRALWECWKRVARKIGDFQARLILIVFYFVVLGPFAIGLRLGADPLAIKPATAKGWRLREHVKGTPMERALRQF
jgi:hypothetical protein